MDQVGHPPPPPPNDQKLQVAYSGAAVSPDFDFAQEVACARLLPWEASRLHSESLGSLISGGGAIAIGAKLGLAAVGGIVMVYGATEATKPVAAEIGRAVAAKLRDWMGLPAASSPTATR
jgi:hypothetical protein